MFENIELVKERASQHLPKGAIIISHCIERGKGSHFKYGDIHIFYEYKGYSYRTKLPLQHGKKEAKNVDSH